MNLNVMQQGGRLIFIVRKGWSEPNAIYQIGRLRRSRKMTQKTEPRVDAGSRNEFRGGGGPRPTEKNTSVEKK